jgi:hypothetical protein
MTKVRNHGADKTAAKKQPKTTTKFPITKQAKIITLLQRQKGATLGELGKMTEWQEHSIRGFMSGTLKKRMGLDIISEKNSKGTRRYRINNSKDAPSASVVPKADTGGKE